ncbi:MAG: hypothetical protein EPN97_00260 [Alphaproteobacteria bacterium]|nr:MAG: hypothetical protein EPN97_00260 [Alphaproteobacteria bacterium]
MKKLLIAVVFLSILQAVMIWPVGLSYAQPVPATDTPPGVPDNLQHVLKLMNEALSPPVVELPEKSKIPVLSDQDLLNFAAKAYNWNKGYNKVVLLGLHYGIPVVVWYQCSDLCPQMAARYIYYQLPKGMECAAAGGEEGIGHTALPAETITRFCEPSVLHAK